MPLTGVMLYTEAGKIALQCWEDIPKHFPNVVVHAYVVMPNHLHGLIEITDLDTEKKSKLGNIIFDDKIEKLEVNSFHTQGIDTLGDGLKISSKSIDGSIESIESNGSNFVIGVQWNPEYLMSSYDVELFDKFCKVVAQS
jgi:gamma-glutamyl-gamma-aminobutyrate hydrolase PuuD